MPRVTRQAAAKTPPPPGSGAAPTVTAPALVHGGIGYVEKLAALVVNPQWAKLPPTMHSAIVAYLNNHHDMVDRIAERLPLFAEVHDAQESRKDSGFEKWLQGQREPLKQFYAGLYRPVRGGPLVDLHPLTAEQRVDQLLAAHQPLTASFVLAELMTCPPGLRQYLVDHAVARLDFVEVGEIARGVRGDDAFRDTVAVALLKHAVALQSQSRREGDRAHRLAQCCAANLTVAMDGAGDRLGLLLSQMSSKDAALFAVALGGEQPRLESALWFDQFLAALNSAPRTAATSAIVENIYRQIEPGDLARAPALAHDLAVAVASEWHAGGTAKAEASRLEGLMQGRCAELLFGGSPARKVVVFNALRNEGRITADLLAHEGGDPVTNRTVTNAMAHAMIATQRMMPFGAAEEDAAWRLGGMLSIPAGAQLFFSDKVPALARGQALAAIIEYPIDSSSFKAGENAWLAPALAGPIAELYAEGHGSDASQSLPGLSLDNMVGFAMGMPATLPKGQAWQDLWNGLDAHAVTRKVAAGEPVTPKDLGAAYDLLTGVSFYGDQKTVAAIVKQIKASADTDPPLVKLLPVTFFGENGPITCPLFRVRSGVNGEGDSVYAYVDNTGRKYDSIEEWVKGNRLPPGKAYYPADGHISRLTNGHGEMKLASADTPRTHQEIREALDTAAMVGCFAAGVVGVVVTGGTLALVAAGVGAASGGWMAFRSGSDLVDRYTHGQSISPLNMEALGDHLGVAGGLLGSVAFIGRAAGVARFGETAAATVVGWAEKGAAFAGGAGLVHQAVMLKDVPPEDRPYAILKLNAFGGLMLAGAGGRPPGAMPVPPETPVAPTLPTARLLPPTGAPAAAGPPKTDTPGGPAPKPVTPTPTSVSSGGRLNGPVRLPVRDEVYSNPDQPKGGDNTYYGNQRWPNGRGRDPASPPVPPALLFHPGPGEPGAAHAGATAPGGPSRQPGGRPGPAPVDPNTRQMAGDQGGKPPEKPPTPPPSSGTPKPGEGAPPRPRAEGRGGKPSEVRVAGDRVQALQKALEAARQRDPSAVPELERRLREAEKQFDDALNRQLAAVADARRQAGRAPVDKPAPSRQQDWQAARISWLENKIAALQETIAGLEQRLRNSIEQSDRSDQPYQPLDRKQITYDLMAAEADLDATEQALDLAKTQLQGPSTAPPPAAGHPSISSGPGAAPAGSSQPPAVKPQPKPVHPPAVTGPPVGSAPPGDKPAVPPKPNEPQKPAKKPDAPDGKAPPRQSSAAPLQQGELARLADRVAETQAELERQEAAGVVAPGVRERYEAALKAFEEAAARWTAHGSNHVSDLNVALRDAVETLATQRNMAALGVGDPVAYGDAIIKLNSALSDLEKAMPTATPEQVRIWKPEIEARRADLENSVWQLAKQAYEARQKLAQEMAKPANQRSAADVGKWGDIIGKYDEVTSKVRNEPAKSLTQYVSRLIAQWGGSAVQDIALRSPRDPPGEVASKKMMELEAARRMPEQDGKGTLVLQRMNEARAAIGRYYDAAKSAAANGRATDQDVKRDELGLAILINEYRFQNQQIEMKPNDQSRPTADGLLDQTGQLSPDQVFRGN